MNQKYDMSDLQPHAVTQIQRETSPDVYVTDTYSYDANGNMITDNQFGTSYTYTYNAENRLASVNNVTTNEQWYFTYDGDGNRIMEDYRLAGITQSYRYFFAGGAYEVIDDVTAANEDQIKQYYFFANQLIAMDDGTNWNFFATDHLSSTSVVMDSNGNLLSANRYMPYGELRTDTSLTEISETDLGYTGQRNYSGFELMDYNARFYNPYQNHFAQPDTIIPNLTSSIGLNRYAYANNNPILYNDPSGHCAGLCIALAMAAIGVAFVSMDAAGLYTLKTAITQDTWSNKDYYKTVGKGAIIGAAIGLAVATAPVAIAFSSQLFLGAAIYTANISPSFSNALVSTSASLSSFSTFLINQYYSFANAPGFVDNMLSGLDDIGFLGSDAEPITDEFYREIFIDDLLEIAKPGSGKNVYEVSGINNAEIIDDLFMNPTSIKILDIPDSMVAQFINNDDTSYITYRSVSTSKPHGPTLNINNISNRYELEMFKIKLFP